jgi:hypothetical protein
VKLEGLKIVSDGQTGADRAGLDWAIKNGIPHGVRRVIMSIQHTTRTGKTYYLHVGQGKSGKPNYFFSTKPEGPLVNSVPEGFEIYETIGGQVFLRRKQPKLITDEELAMVKEALKRHAEEWRYKVEIKNTAIIIYETSANSAGLERFALPWISKATIKQSVIQNATYMAVMRFVLADPEKRLFLAERFCFRGSVEDWIDIGGPAQKLPVLLKKFIKHLGKESIFELY